MALNGRVRLQQKYRQAAMESMFSNGAGMAAVSHNDGLAEGTEGEADGSHMQMSSLIRNQDLNADNEHSNLVDEDNAPQDETVEEDQSR